MCMDIALYVVEVFLTIIKMSQFVPPYPKNLQVKNFNLL